MRRAWRLGHAVRPGPQRIASAKAADRIAAKLPDSRDSVEVAHGVLSLVEAFARVDRARARAWLAPRAADPLFRFSAERVRMILGGH